jgi:hypothetical protein
MAYRILADYLDQGAEKHHLNHQETGNGVFFNIVFRPDLRPAKSQ